MRALTPAQQAEVAYYLRRTLASELGAMQDDPNRIPAAIAGVAPDLIVAQWLQWIEPQLPAGAPTDYALVEPELLLLREKGA